MTISYITGDATRPIMKPALIMHVCNDVGGWGRGFVLALSKRWPQPEWDYRAMDARPLGEVRFVQTEDPQIIVANMIAQRDVRACRGCGHPPIRYDALATCLGFVEGFTNPRSPYAGHTIHAPRLGAGLAGGDWTVIEALIEKILKDRAVYIYDLP